MSEEISTKSAKVTTTTEVKELKLCYYLIMANIAIPFLSLAAMIIAIVAKGKNPEEFLKSHYQLVVRTFWISIVYIIIVILTMFVLIGFVLGPIVVFWQFYRAWKGLESLEKGGSHPNPKTWLW